MSEIWTVKSILDWCCDFLERHGDKQPRFSAEWLLSEATGLTRIDLYMNFDRPLSNEERTIMRDWVRRRANGEPLQLIAGKASFRYLTLHVAPNVLIPRPETEVLVSEAMKALKLPKTCDVVEMDEEGERIVSSELPQINVLDLCTGSGCIACSIAYEYPAAFVIASDISPDAFALAQKNVDAFGLQDRVKVIKSNLFEEIKSQNIAAFDLVISNPPYVPTSVCQSLDAEVKDFEPLLALDGGDDGLDVFRSFTKDAFDCLKPGGVLAVELFEDHLQKASQLANEAGFIDVEIKQDLVGKDRVLLARKPE